MKTIAHVASVHCPLELEQYSVELCLYFYGRSFHLRYLHFLTVQEVKAAILEDMVRLGKEGGLKSFEQVEHWLSQSVSQLRFINDEQ